MSTAETMIVSAAVVWVYVTAIWVLSLALKNASIIDIFWGFGFVLLAALYHTTLDGFGGRSVLVTSLVIVWGLRLSGYILWRNWGEEEDYRYQKWRRDDGENFWWTSYFRVFLLQGVALWVISQPLRAAIGSATPDNFTIIDGLGTAVWCVGFYFEAIGDYQMARFREDPANKGKVMDRGLWRYTRHPNYFGDAAQWWGFYIIAAGTGNGWLTIYSPLLMTFLLTRVSGAALLESEQKRSKPGYKDYIERTSGFIPWLPQRRAAE